MACIYTRKDSPFFWIKWRDERGALKQESTRLRIGVAPDVRRARQLEAERTAEELGRGQGDAKEHGWLWAREFLQTRYKASPVTSERYLSAWTSLLLFLEEKKIESPQHLERRHCFQFIAWRQVADKARGKYGACHNTALMDLKALRIVLQEAVERGMVQANVCTRLKVKRNRAKEKPELTKEDCQAIRDGIETVTDPVKKQMFRTSFEIARLQGCRLSETRISLADVDVKAGTIRFRSAKGGKDFVTALHPGLHALFADLKSEGRTATWEIPPGRGRQWASAAWWNFLDGLGLKKKDITFHGTRVTVITELARGGVHESKAMAYVGHAAESVHRIYQRLQPADLADCVSVVGSGKRPSSSTEGGASAT